MTRKISTFAAGARVPLTVAVAAGTVAMGMLLATPAVAADSADILLELSHDGVHYSPGTVQDIFANTGGYVPGESRPGTVWVRNASPDAAQFSLGIANTDPVSESVLPPHLSLDVGSGTGRASTGAFPAAGNCNPVLQSWIMSGGESLRLDMNLGLALQAPNATRNQESNFDLVFVLQGIGGGEPVSPCAGSPVTLPATGLPAALPDNISVGTAPLSGGTAQGADTTTRVLRRNSAGIGAEAALLPATGTELKAAPEPKQTQRRDWPWDAMAQSNVVANVRSAWPWIAALSAGAYVIISLRRRNKNP